MSDPVLPPEILDYILDLLHNEPETLKQCCLVSKSCVPRTRKYLFANIEFYSARTFDLWNNIFPDPTNSPASHVSTLAIHCYPKDQGADWIRAFARVVQLRLICHPGLSQNPESFYNPFSCPDLFDFICSFPRLEDLFLDGNEALEDSGNDFDGLQSSPPLTGTLKLIVYRGMGSIPRHLLNLPNGLRFRELVLLLVLEKDCQCITELVLKCSDTLECLDIEFRWFGAPNLIDLSKATKLKELIFRLRALVPRPVVEMLETITPEHRDLRQVSIHLHKLANHLTYLRSMKRDATYFKLYVGDDFYKNWLEIDCLLVRFWESRSIRSRVVLTESLRDAEVKYCIGCLFPDITARGIIDLVEEC